MWRATERVTAKLMLPSLVKLLARAWDSPTLNTWLSLFSRTVGGVVVLPTLLRRFDPGEVAVWYLFATIIGIGMLLDLGINPTLTRFVAYANAGPRQHPGAPPNASQPDLPTLYAAMRRLYLGMALAVVVLLGVVGTWALSVPISRLDSPRTAYALWALIVLLSPLAFTNNLKLAFLQGSGFIAVVRRWDAVFGMLGILSNLAVLEYGLGLTGLVISTQVWGIVAAWRTKRIFNSKLGSMDRTERLTLRETGSAIAMIWPSSWRVGLGSIAYLGAQHSSGLIYATMGPKERLASYLLGIQVFNIIRASSMAPFYTKLPVLARMSAEGRVGEVRATAGAGMVRSYWVFVAWAAGAGILVPYILDSIGSKTRFPSDLLWGGITIGGLLERFGGMHQNILAAFNVVRSHWAGLGFLVVYLGFVLGLIRALDVLAFPVAMIAGHVLFYSWYSGRHSYRALGTTFLGFERTKFLPAAVTMVVVVWATMRMGPAIRATLPVVPEWLKPASSSARQF